MKIHWHGVLLLTSLVLDVSCDGIPRDYYHVLKVAAKRMYTQTPTTVDGDPVEVAAVLGRYLGRGVGMLGGESDGSGKEEGGPEEGIAEQFMEMLSNDSSECSQDLELVITGIFTKQKWALQMLDATGKPGSGLLQGELRWPGSYQECLQSVSPANLTFPPRPVQAQYCLLIVDPSAGNPYGLGTVGMCLPDSCNTTQLQTWATTYLMPLVNYSFPVGVWCQQPPGDLSTAAIGVIFMLTVFGLLLVTGTAYDIVAIQRPKWQREKEFTSMANGHAHDEVIVNENMNGKTENVPLLKKDSSEKSSPIPVWGRLLVSFSVYTNGQKLLNTEHTAGSLTAVHGIRFLSMTWVLLGHTLAFAMGLIQNTKYASEHIFHTWTYLAITEATVSVDSFFLLSGLLVAYLLVKEMEKVESVSKMKWGLFYFHRFWRLTPPYMLVLGVYIPLFAYFGSGPFWPSTGLDVGGQCKNYWWRNLLYINNLFPMSEGCMGWAWYLANDMQFFIISPLILIPMFLKPLVGYVVFFLFLFASLLTPSLISLHYGMPAGYGLTTMNQVDTQASYMDLYYVRPYCRMGPYLIGLLTGYALQRTKCKVKMHWVVVMLGWAAAAAINLSIIYGLWPVSEGNAMSDSLSAFFNGAHRTAWGMGLAWVVFACATGHGGFVNTLLSWKAVVPLSRLTYCCYLVHPVVMYTFYYSRKTLFYMDDANFMYTFMGHLMTTYGIALLTSLTFEAPMLGLEKVILKRS